MEGVSMEENVQEEVHKIERIVRDWCFFEEFNSKEIHRSVCCMSLHRVEKGDVIFRKGDIGDYLFFVMNGSISIMQNKNGIEKKIASLGEGAIVGEVSFFDGFYRSADAVAEKQSEILILSTSTLNQLIKKDEHLGVKLLMRLGKTVSLRLRKMVGDEVEVGGDAENLD